MSLGREAMLAELGIPQWRARPGVAFPGAPVATPSEAAPVEPQVSHDATPVAPRVEAAPEPVLDLCVHARASSPGETELLENILQAARGLKDGLRVDARPLDETQAEARTRVVLDGQALPSLAAMAGDPSLKRPVWAAIKSAVAALS